MTDEISVEDNKVLKMAMQAYLQTLLDIRTEINASIEHYEKKISEIKE